MDRTATFEMRAARHAALGDPARLAIVDELSVSDRAPVELRRLLDMESNLLAHHLDVLERVGLIERSRSSGDGRRRYVHLLPGALEGLAPGRPIPTGAALFVCSANSARSQLAAALWHQATGLSRRCPRAPIRPSGSTLAPWLPPDERASIWPRQHPRIWVTSVRSRRW